MIPYPVFVLYQRTIDSLEAGDMLRGAYAAALGQAMAVGGDQPAVRQRLRRLTRAAYPEE